MASWLGLLLPPPPDPDASPEATSAQLEHLLRLKCLLLLAAALRLRAFRSVMVGVKI